MPGTTLNNVFQWNGDIFSDIVLPNGMNVETCKSAIFRRCWLLEMVYPEVEILKPFSDAWFQMHLDDFQRAWDALHIQYDPLLDYKIVRNFSTDKTENGTSTTDTTADMSSDTSRKWDEKDVGKTVSDSSKAGETTGTSNSKTVQNENSTTDGNVVNQVAPYNASTFVNDNNSDSVITTDRNVTTTVTGSTGGTSKDTESGTVDDTLDKSGNETVSVTAKNSGNVNGTTSKKGNESGDWSEEGNRQTRQEMILAELRIAERNLYDYIASLWEDEFCIAVY